MRRPNHNSQDRRRARRAAQRRTTGGELQLLPDDVAEIEALVAAASGSTSLPLSDRNVAWDASAADKRVREWADATDAPNAKYARAFFVKQGDGSAYGDYKLGYADVIDGKLVAVWKGVTAVAGVLQGARGGANITDAEKAATKTKVEAYYKKAADQFDDDTIKVPWAADEANGESAITLLVLAELDSHEGLDIVREESGAIVLAGGSGDAMAQALERRAYWESDGDADVIEVAVPDDSETLDAGAGLTDEERAELAALLGHEAELDAPEDQALAALEAYASEPDPAAITEAYLAQHPELAELSAEVEKVVRHALRSASLQAAAGDVAWFDEDGFIDLLADVNELLCQNGYGEGEDDYCWPGPRAINVAVTLDKVLICDGDDYYVAPISIDSMGEPVLSDRTDWIPVDGGAYLEKAAGEDDDDEAMTAAARMRFALRDIVLSADGAMAPPLPPEHQPKEVVPKRTSRVTDPTPPAGASADGELRWTATFVPEGRLTEDGRAFAPGALILPPEEGSRELPLSLMAMIETTEGGHIGAKVAGRIDQMWREGNLVKASGVFSEEEYGQMIGRMVGSGELRGLSVDIAPLEWERAPLSAWFDEAGNWIAERDENGDWAPAGEEPTIEDAVERLFGGGEDMILVITKGVIGAATVCPFPAFGDANIALVASGSADLYRYTGQAGFTVVRERCDCETLVAAAAGAEAPAEAAEEESDALTAAAAGLAPEKPPADWFDDPQFEELTPMTITDDGRIFGHAWAWDTCHVSFDGCVTAPESETGYAYFELGEIECAGGERLPVGKITLDAPHAGQRLSRQEATRHYDHTGTVVAYVRFGEDEHGGWFAGTVRPDLPAEKLRLLRGATVSGDWRGVDGNLELIALLAVNVPGFPVPRQRALVAAAADGGEPELLSLVAAGVVAPLSAEQADVIAALVADAEAE